MYYIEWRLHMGKKSIDQGDNQQGNQKCNESSKGALVIKVNSNVRF